MNVSGSGGAAGALIRWNAMQGVLAPPRGEDGTAHAAGSLDGRRGAQADTAPSPPSSPAAFSQAGAQGGERAPRGGPPTVLRAAGDPRALAQFYVHGLEPTRVGGLIDTYA